MVHKLCQMPMYVHVRVCHCTFPDNPFQKPIQNVVLGANWNVHIWNRLRDCYSRLYTGTLKSGCLQCSTFQRLKFQLKLTWRPFAIGAILILPNPIAKCAQGCSAPRAGLLIKLQVSKSCNTRCTRFTEFLAPIGSENSNLFKWIFTKMAVSMVSDPESEQELAESRKFAFLNKIIWVTRKWPKSRTAKGRWLDCLICRLIRDHNPAHSIHYLWLSIPCRFQAWYSFPSYLLVPASALSRDRWFHSY